MPVCQVENNVYESNIEFYSISLSILAYNINGLSNKVMFPKFFSFIYKYDIFFLSETHVTEGNISNYIRHFSEFELKWIPALKTSKFGRASGGCILGYKKSIISSDLKVEIKDFGSCIVFFTISEQYKNRHCPGIFE